MQEIPIVLIGHKDHGKSTLIGRLLIDSGSIIESRVKGVKEVDVSYGQKFELAHLVDSFKEEREREMTMDTTRVVLKGKERNYQLIDVPGHAELISNMLTGASAADVALLVVSIEEGIKEQTRQHLEIAKLLGLEQLGVIVNKMDTVDYKKEAFDKITGKLQTMLTNIGYFIRDIRFFPISAWEGDNVIKKSERMPWYEGLTVMEFLEREIEEPESFENLPPSFLVQDKYPEDDQEVLVGKIETGKFNTGQEILLLPDNKSSEIKEIRDSDSILKEARTGQNIGIVLSDNLDISRGVVGVASDSDLKVDDALSGEVFWIEKPSQENLVLECGTAQVEGRLNDFQSFERGEKTLYKIFLKKPIVFDPTGKTILGKIVLKDKGKIIGVGTTY